jgi:hypothetical protein
VQAEKVSFENSNKLKNILLFYGKYWVELWASYYWKFDFGDWKKIIRSINLETPVFKTFFKDYLENDLDKIYADKVVCENEVNFETYDKLKIFKWYASKLNEALWSQGRYIAFSHFKHPNQDKYFKNSRELVNIKGNFNGGTPKVLSEHII